MPERTTFHGLKTQDRHVYWDDVYPSAATVGRGVNAPQITAYSGNYLAPEFVGSSATLKDLTLQFQIYHSWEEGTEVIPHAHFWVPDDVTGGDIKVYFDIHWDNVNDTGALSTTTYSTVVTRGASAGISRNQIFSAGSIDATGMEISSIMGVRLYRDPADVADTFTSSIWLRSADVHILKNTPGSRQQFLKV